MQTDTLFYSLFQTSPALLFELIGQSEVDGMAYTFRSVELKQTAFRMDGVFIPETCRAETPVYCVEVQFQRDEQLYARLSSEVALFLRQNPAMEHWTVVVIYGDQSCAPRNAGAYAPLLRLPEVQLVYLDAFPDLEDESIEMGLIRLIVEPEQSAMERARRLVEQVTVGASRLSTAEIIEMIETIVVYKFPQLSWQEVEAMFGLSELKQTRVYQQGREEGIEQGREEGIEQGREEGERALILRLLNRRLSEVSEAERLQIEALSVEQLEVLGEALLDFSSGDDLREWLSAHRQQTES